MTGDSLRIFGSNKRFEARLATSRKLSNGYLIRLSSNVLSQKALRCISSLKQGLVVSGAGGDVLAFLLTTAVLEIVRRFSKAKCPFVWRGLQALQLLCYPPFKWIQRWAPFKGLVKNMQTLSKPLLVLSIATVFSDEPQSINGIFSGSDDVQASTRVQSEGSSQLSPNERSLDEIPKSLAPEKWLLELYEELDKQGIIIPERLSVEELRRFYSASDGDFSRLLSSVKKTIHWRQTYTLLSAQELEDWFHFVFWHGCDVKRRPCLIIRLGLACSNPTTKFDRSLFSRAVVSQIEHGVLNLLDVENPQITVLMDCEGLSPFGFPVHMMRSCAVLLQDHYPNRLGCLLVVRLPPIARVVTQTLFQVLKPKTREKLRIVGDNGQRVLFKYFDTLPPFLGGNCSCSKCSDGSFNVLTEEITSINEDMDVADNVDVPSPDDQCANIDIDMSREQVTRTAIKGALMLLLFIFFILGMYFPQMLPQLYNRRG